jgi:hypothetical protein
MRTVAVRLCSCELPPSSPERYSLLSATNVLAMVRTRVPVADACGACLQPKGIGLGTAVTVSAGGSTYG